MSSRNKSASPATKDGVSDIRSNVVIEYLQSLVERDKTTLARELHDDLGGFLVASAMDIAVLKQRFADHDDDSARVFDRLTHTLNAAVDLMRRVTEELRPTLLDNVGLLAALRWQINQICRRNSITCTEHMPETEPHLTASELISIFRAGQEALLVAEDQPDVTDVDFTLRIDEGVLSLIVCTNGAAAPPAESRGHVALALLRHRVAALGGTVDLERRAIGGTALTARIPLTGPGRDG